MALREYRTKWQPLLDHLSRLMGQISEAITRFHLKGALLTIIFVILLACFGLQVRLNMIAFFEKRTIMSVSDVDMEEVEMPEITFCAGFRLDALNNAMMDSDTFGRRPNSLGRMTYFDYHSNETEATEDEIDAWWRNITYDLDELVLGIILGNEHESNSNDMQEVEFTPKQLLEDFNSKVKVNEISSTFGRCYEVTTLLPFKSAEYVTIVFNMTLLRSRRMAVYIYEHGKMGLLSNYWATPVYSMSMGAGETIDLPIIKEETSYFSNEKIPCAKSYEGIDIFDEDEAQYNCVLKWARESYRDINCTKVCSVPQSYLYTSEMCPPVPPCLTKKEASCAMRELRRVYTSQNRMGVTGCRTACVRHSYRVTVRHEISSWDGVSSGHNATSVLTVFYPSSRIIRSVETRLLDNSAILSAIGGSLGLFLGFSFWECTRATITKLDRFAKSALISRTPTKRHKTASLIGVPTPRAVTPYNSAKSVLKISRGKIDNDFKIDIVHNSGNKGLKTMVDGGKIRPEVINCHDFFPE